MGEPPQSPQPLLARALACAANAIFITDKGGTIVWINDAFTKLTGYSSDETIGRAPSLLKSGRQNAAFYSGLWQTILAGRVWKGEVVEQRKDGTSLTVDEVITPLFDEQGEVTHFLAIQHDLTHQKALAQHDHHLAYHDALTDLANRALFLEVQKKSLAHARRTSRKFATLFLDLDRFKPINDQFGHKLGDELLRAVADRLRGAVREADTVARFGGDEFAILVTDLDDPATATILARKLVESLSQPFIFHGQRVDVRASIGVAMYPDDGDDPETLLIHADKAMYEAKSSGGNRYRCYQKPSSTASSIASSNPSLT